MLCHVALAREYFGKKGGTGVLDWNAALGDPLSDLACSRLEFRYRQVAGMRRFAEVRGEGPFEVERLALWQTMCCGGSVFYGEGCPLVKKPTC